MLKIDYEQNQNSVNNHIYVYLYTYFDFLYSFKTIFYHKLNIVTLNGTHCVININQLKVIVIGKREKKVRVRAHLDTQSPKCLRAQHSTAQHNVPHKYTYPYEFEQLDFTIVHWTIVYALIS